MSDASRPERALPAVPNLEQQKKRARELLNDLLAHDPRAERRLRDHHPRFAGRSGAELRGARLALHDAQLVIAREHGFPSWPAFKAHIESPAEPRRTRPFVRDPGWYDERARGLVEVLPDGAPSVIEQVRTWHPRFGDASDEAIRSAAFTLDDARLVYARQHGFAGWPEFAEHLRRLASDAGAEPFMEIVEAGRSGDWPRAVAILHAHPGIVRARGTNGNTLLNLACSLVACPAPDPAAEPAAEPAPDATAVPAGGDRLGPVRLLLDAGADPNQANDRGWTPLHQAGYRDDAEMAALLLDAGARADVAAHGEGGTPLVVALFWGHREVSELLATHGAVPANLRVAAGLGREDLLRRCFTGDATLTAAARAARGFYRPHSGFPAWRPSDDPQEVLDEALVWAAKAGRIEAMSLLVRRGARISADPYRGTLLLWAAANGRLDAVRWLLDHGADVNQRATFGGPTHGEGVTALHLAAQDDRVEIIELLLARGADPTVEDALHHGTPAGWAAAFDAADARTYLEARRDRAGD